MAGASSPPRIPTLAYAVLALLAREPLTGYELSRQMRDPIGFLWQAGHSQIYPILARLEELGWVSSTSGKGPGPRPKRRYAATVDGVAALRGWVEGPTARHGRDTLLLRVYASWVAAPEATLRFLAEAETQHAHQLAVFLARRAAVRARHGPEPPGTAEFADYATLRRGIGHERGRLAWVRWLRRQLASDGEPAAADRQPSAPDQDRARG
jgi:DNA-binding PadR family transcriptional regulator